MNRCDECLFYEGCFGRLKNKEVLEKYGSLDKMFIENAYNCEEFIRRPDKRFATKYNWGDRNDFRKHD